jgi:hypothetical protein
MLMLIFFQSAAKIGLKLYLLRRFQNNKISGSEKRIAKGKAKEIFFLKVELSMFRHFSEVFS